MKVILAWIFAALIASAAASPATAEPVRRAVAAKVYDFLRDGRAANLPAEVWLDPVTFARPGFPAP